MKQLEHRTNSSLYNIESLLRNAVFQGGSSAAPQSRPGAQVPAVAVPQSSRSSSRNKNKPYGYQPPSDDEYDA